MATTDDEHMIHMIQIRVSKVDDFPDLSSMSSYVSCFYKYHITSPLPLKIHFQNLPDGPWRHDLAVVAESSEAGDPEGALGDQLTTAGTQVRSQRSQHTQHPGAGARNVSKMW